MFLIKNKKIKSILLIFILISLISVTLILKNSKTQTTIKVSENYQNTINKNMEETAEEKVVEETKEIEKETIWQIEIPIINLNANISEGTSAEILNKYVGHFSNTSTKDGNIGLAAHNRGYPVNYFENIKSLEIGDEIIYKYGEYQKNYEVVKKIIIDDTDWSYLEETKDNRITLITCVENDPSHRRCIQAIEKTKLERGK